MLKNQLHQLVFDHYPSYHTFFSNIDGKTAMAFYERFPSPYLLKQSTLEELTDLIISHSKGSLGAEKAIHIWELVHSEGVTASDYQDVHDFTTQSTIRQLRVNLQEIDNIEAQLERFLIHFDYPLTTMKGIDTITACRLIAEIGDVERFSSPAALARYAGIAPATHSSGGSSVEFASKRGNRQLNSIFYQIALGMIATRGKNNIAINPFFYDYFHRKLSEGKTKKQALKCVKRRLVNIIWGIMKHKEDYINPPVAFIDDDELNDNQQAHRLKLASTLKQTNDKTCCDML